jgi:uncharacterized protein (TIGR02246 family)
MPRAAALLLLVTLVPPVAPAADLLPAQAGGSAEADAAAIRQVIANYAAARESRDPTAIEALFTADADQLVSSGEWRRGRAALVKGALASSARTGGIRTLDVEAMRMIGVDTAIADARYEISGLEGGAVRRMWSTFVLVKRQGQWRISAIRNMLPAAPAPATPRAAAGAGGQAELADVRRSAIPLTW